MQKPESLIYELGAKWIKFDTTRGDFGAIGVFVGPTYLLEGAEVWNISCPTNWHYAHVNTALQLGANKILLETPSTERLDEARELYRNSVYTLIQVNYVERAQPVMIAVLQWIKEKEFYPNYMFFRRSHDVRRRLKTEASSDIKWTTFNTLCHSVSVLELILQHTWWKQKRFRKDLKVLQSKMISWQERYKEEFPFKADVDSDFVLSDSEKNGNFKARICGASDKTEHRYFVLSDGWRAVWVNTLSYPEHKIFPSAVAVYGSDKTRKLVALAEKVIGLPSTFDNINTLRTELGGKWLFVDFNHSPTEKMIQNLHEAQKEQDLICPLSTAIWVEEIIYLVYKTIGIKLLPL